MSKRHNEELKRKLIVAAGQVFAEKGFAGASVREICDLAGANIAAVNYYFGDKRNLYREVLAYMVEEGKRRFPFTAAMDTTLPPQTRLTELVRTILRRILDRERGIWMHRIIDREIFDPSESFEVLQGLAFEPVIELAASIVEQLCAGIGRDQAKFVGAGIIGQCSFYSHFRTPLAIMTSQNRFPRFDVEGLTELITKVSLKGVSAMGKQGC
jgi:TetR/AcrR family transcriptional regulator, regulator of cefoperazone and chloramphenicol sensitivity